ncbi:hypothetical protein TNCT6_69560 [Streptomyces sp. 6-11-2]|nr:hypothetical protein TNCT6_69560 [Streptomyces sp. 6-11-2]
MQQHRHRGGALRELGPADILTPFEDRMATAGIDYPRVLVEESSDRRVLGGHIHPAHLSVPRTAAISPDSASTTLSRDRKPARKASKRADRRCSTPQMPTATQLDESGA